MKDSISKRLERLLQIKNGGNQSQLARFVGVSPQAVQHWIAGETSPRGKNLGRAADFLGVTPSELLFGSQGDLQNVTTAPIASCKIPLLDNFQVRIRAEDANSYEANEVVDWILTDLELSHHAFAIEIKDDSMLPDFRPGDRVIIDPETNPNPGDFVAAKYGKKEVTFKKYRSRGIDGHGDPVFELVPLNPDYETMRSDQTPITIIGTMVEHRRYRKK